MASLEDNGPCPPWVDRAVGKKFIPTRTLLGRALIRRNGRRINYK